MRALSLFDTAFVARSTSTTDWAQRVVANGGAMPSGTTIAAMETFRLAMISAGLDTKMHALCVFVPDSLIAATTPLFVGIGNGLWTNNNFVGGDLNSDGLKGNGSTKYLDTGVLATSGQAVAAGTGNCGLSLVITDSSNNGNEIDIGRVDSASGGVPALYMGLSALSMSVFSVAGTATANQIQFSDGTRSGFVSSNSVAGTLNMYVGCPQITLYSASSKAVSTLTTSMTDKMYCFAVGIAGTASSFSAKRLSFAAIHQGLSSGDAATLMGLVNTLRSSLGGGTGDPGTAWSYRVVANGGAAPAGGSVTACNTFVSALNTAGLITKMVAVNPFAPDSLTACRVPLIASFGNQLWTNNNFVGGDLTVNGLIGNGSSKYLQTGIITNAVTNLTNTNGGCSTLVFDATNTATCAEIGNYNGGSQLFGMQRISGSTGAGYCWGTSTGNNDSVSGALPSSTWPGFLSINRTAINSLALYMASTATSFATVSSTSGNRVETTLNSTEIYALALNNGGPINYSPHRMSFAAVHSGLTSGESQSLYNAMAACRTTFGGGNP